MKNGHVFKNKEFYNELEKIVTKYKLNKVLVTNKITVVTEPYISLINLEILKNNLEKLFFNDINFVQLSSLFKQSKNNILLIFNNQYLYLIKRKLKKEEPIFIDFKLFNFNINTLTKYLSIFINNKNVIIFGFNNKVEELSNLLATNTKNKVYFVANPVYYILKNVKYINF